MTHRYVPSRSNSRTNRDRREQSFARSVIARAAQINAEQIAEARQAVAECGPDICPICRTPLSGNCEIRDDNYPYCSKRCSLEAEADNAHD